MKRNQDTAMSQPVSLYPSSLSMFNAEPVERTKSKDLTMRELLADFGVPAN